MVRPSPQHRLRLKDWKFRMLVKTLRKQKEELPESEIGVNRIVLYVQRISNLITYVKITTRMLNHRFTVVPLQTFFRHPVVACATALAISHDFQGCASLLAADVILAESL